MSMKTISASDIVANQFANDWLLVIENDQDAWNQLTEEVKDSNYDLVIVSNKLREEWDTLVEQMADVVEDKVSELGALLLRQMLAGMGTYPFDIITRDVIARVKEAN
jgi:hypothetical protein